MIWLLLAVLLLLWGIHVYRKRKAAQAAAVAAAQHQPPIPVVIARVEQKDVPIYLEGLGTVQAFNSVTIHVRVDGQITRIAFREGQDVRKGDLLLQIDPAPFEAQLAQAEAQLLQNQALLANALRDYERNREMYERRVIAQQQYDTQVALVEQLRAAVTAGEAAIRAQRVQLGYTTIRAPIDGRIGLRLLDVGNIAHASDTTGILVINQLHPISVVFTLPEKHLFSIQQEMKKRKLAVHALDRNNLGPPISTGELTVVDNQIDINTGTIRLKATFHNDDLRLWPGQFVNTRLLLMTRRDGIIVPAAAIQRGPEGSFAFVVKPDNTVEVRAVKVAQTQLNQSLIEEGLKPGETVVVEGQYRLQAGSAVKIVPADPNSGAFKKTVGGQADEERIEQNNARVQPSPSGSPPPTSPPVPQSTAPAAESPAPAAPAEPSSKPPARPVPEAPVPTPGPATVRPGSTPGHSRPPEP